MTLAIKRIHNVPRHLSYVSTLPDITQKQKIYVFFSVLCTTFTKKEFYLNPPICNQNGRMWADGRNADVKPHRLLVEWEKFAPRVMVSAGVCVGGKGHVLGG